MECQLNRFTLVFAAGCNVLLQQRECLGQRLAHDYGLAELESTMSGFSGWARNGLQFWMPASGNTARRRAGIPESR